MKLFTAFFSTFLRKNSGTRYSTKEKSIADENLPVHDYFSMLSKVKTDDSYFLNAWVNIAVGILIRNIARAKFMLTRDGSKLTIGTGSESTGTLALELERV